MTIEPVLFFLACVAACSFGLASALGGCLYRLERERRIRLQARLKEAEARLRSCHDHSSTPTLHHPLH